MGLLARVVKNEAMKNDPQEIYNWRVYVLTCSACFAGALFGMDIGIIGGVLKLDTFTKYAFSPIRSQIVNGLLTPY